VCGTAAERIAGQIRIAGQATERAANGDSLRFSIPAWIRAAGEPLFSLAIPTRRLSGTIRPAILPPDRSSPPGRSRRIGALRLKIEARPTEASDDGPCAGIRIGCSDGRTSLPAGGEGTEIARDGAID